MRIRKTQNARDLNRSSRLAIALAFVIVLTLLACSVNVKKDSSGEDKKVDIDTPIGGIHVDKGADAQETGLPVYPGARVKEKKDSDDNKSANVDISFFGHGVRVVAVEYESDDPPSKIIAYYKGQLKKYGSVLECHTAGHDVNVGKNDSKELACDSDGGKSVELKVGASDNQRVVAVDPDGKGCSFSLVYVRTNSGNTI